ncbi:MAG: Gldg family protein [Clostridia bacterium]|nr:Gldg family protein [Clostridia bacterium]
MKNVKQRLLGFVGSRNFSSGVLVAIIVAIAVFVNAIAYTLVSGFGLYFTFDSGEPLSITDGARDTFAEAKGEGKQIEIIFCMYEDDVKEHDTGALVYRTAKLLEEKYPDFIKIKYTNAITRLDSEGKPFDFGRFATQINESTGETITNYFSSTSVIINCKKSDGMGNVAESFRVLTDKVTGSGFGDFYSINGSYEALSFNGEEIFTAMCSWVIRDEHKSAYVTVGHGETPDATLYNALLCAGYYINDLDLKRNEVPSNADLVIIANPKNDIERAAEGSSVRTELQKLISYKERGGNFFIMMDPYATKLPALTSLVSGFGISPSLTDEGAPQLIKDNRDAITNDGFTIVAGYADGVTTDKMMAAAGISEPAVIVRNASPLSLSGNARPLLVSSPASVCQAGGETTDREGSYAIAAYSTAENGENPAASLFFTSSVYLLANDAMITDGYTNKDFLYSVFDVIFDGGDMPYGCTPVVYDTDILENLTLGTKILYTAIMMAVPTVVLALGIFVVVRRRNR